MRTRTKFVAAILSFGLLGGTTVAAAENTSTEAPRRTVELATATGSNAAGASSPRLPSQTNEPNVSQGGSASTSTTALVRNRVGLRAIKPCVYRRTPTMCVIKVRRLEQRGDRVVAIGTITPRSNPDVHIRFHKRVIGCRTADGVFGLRTLQVAAPTCAILSLVLGPLHLDVLGLVTDLNRVVLNIVGKTGAGNLLGNLLCSLLGILDGGLILARFVSVVTELLAAINAVLRL
jgi:hypothetical protein